MNLSEFYRDNPTIIETKIGDGTGAVVDIKTGQDNSKALNVSVANPVITTLSSVVASTVTRVPSSILNQILVSPNIMRKGLILYNDGTALQYVKFGSIASLIDFTIRLTGQSFYEVQSPIYNGRIDVISSSTDGAIQVTELS